MSTGVSAIRPSIRKLAGYVPGEQPQDRRYIKLNTNENPYPPSPKVLAAVAASATADLRLYPDPTADVLRDAAAAEYGFRREEILAGNGSDDLLAMIVRACVAPSDCVVYPFPTYSLYDTLIAIGDARAVHVPFGSDFALPTKDIEAANGRVTFLCNPNSPSGTLFSLGQIADLARRVRGLLVVDEAYVDFASHSALPLVHDNDNIIVLRTFSKSYSLAGMRIGLAFAPAPLIAELMKVKDSYNLTRLSIVAATAALQDQEWMRANVARVCATRSRLRAALIARGFDVPQSDANFLLARQKTNLQGLYLALKERGILVRYFATPELSNALRITVGTDDEADALLAALADIGPGSVK